MNKSIIQIIKIKFSAACPYIAVFIKEASNMRIYACYQSKYSKVEFPFIYQERVINILLYYCCFYILLLFLFFFCLICIQSTNSLICISYKLFYFIKTLDDVNSKSTICIFSWFNNPSV